MPPNPYRISDPAARERELGRSTSCDVEEGIVLVVIFVVGAMAFVTGVLSKLKRTTELSLGMLMMIAVVRTVIVERRRRQKRASNDDLA